MTNIERLLRAEMPIESVKAALLIALYENAASEEEWSDGWVPTLSWRRAIEATRAYIDEIEGRPLRVDLTHASVGSGDVNSSGYDKLYGAGAFSRCLETLVEDGYNRIQVNHVFPSRETWKGWMENLSLSASSSINGANS